MNKSFRGGRSATAGARPRGADGGYLQAEAARLLGRHGEQGAYARHADRKRDG
ncbi:hypothetical protein [Methylobacterium radiotolerans]|uniref:hypothetical protein n=1 Tax=Methylobacterium radiotolerans TaxID=31998 RepID=UPI0015C6177F|nr:hypothetical protein [Methylobacterium radiotolerans]